MTRRWPAVARVLSAVWRHPLNAGGRTAALWRLLRWQLRARFGIGPATVPYVDGMRLYVQRGLHAASGNWYCGLLEAGEMAFTLHWLRAGDLFVDVGANVGSYSLLATAAGARVIAVEPVPDTLVALRAHLELNGLQTRVQVVPVGVGAQAGRARFTTALGSANRRVASGDVATISVETEVITLDALLGDATPRLIKIDIEGQELAALQGAASLLASSTLRALIVETDEARGAGPRDNPQLRELLARHGFEPCRYDARTRVLSATRDLGINTIFVRDRDEVAARLRAAPRFHLVNGWI